MISELQLKILIGILQMAMLLVLDQLSQIIQDFQIEQVLSFLWQVIKEMSDRQGGTFDESHKTLFTGLFQNPGTDKIFRSVLKEKCAF